MTSIFHWRIQDKKIVNIIWKMVILKLVKEIERDVFRPVTSVRQRKKSESPWRYRHCRILEVCRTLVIHEHRNGTCSPSSLCGSLVEHRSAESEDLRFAPWSCSMPKNRTYFEGSSFVDMLASHIAFTLGLDSVRKRYPSKFVWLLSKVKNHFLR